jgi:hypothetical protein
MAQYNELPVYKATYDLLMAIFQFTKEFSFKYKDYRAIPETTNKPAQPKKTSGSDFWNK